MSEIAEKTLETTEGSRRWFAKAIMNADDFPTKNDRAFIHSLLADIESLSERLRVAEESEREACAKIVETRPENVGSSPAAKFGSEIGGILRDEIAASIRARGA